MAVKKDLYKILGVAPVAQPDEIRKAYRALSKKYHPDLNPNMRRYSEDKMKELVAAYSELNDAEKRKAYDNQPHFQIRRTKKETKRKNPAAGKTKQKEPGFLEKLMSAMGKGKPKAAGEQYDPKQSDVHFMLGISLAENESFYPQARDEFKMSLKFDSHNKEALYNMAVMCYKLGEFDEAIANFQKVLQLDRQDSHAQMMIALLRED